MEHSAVETCNGAGRDVAICTDDCRYLMESLPQLVWTSDPGGRLDYISSEMGAFAGIDPSAPDYLDWPKLVHPDDTEDLVKEWTRCLETGEIPNLAQIKVVDDGVGMTPDEGGRPDLTNIFPNRLLLKT